MQCSFCGSQDTTYKTGISKTGKNAGKKWEAYDCNEKECKNDKGYPNRTWAPKGGSSGPAKTTQIPQRPQAPMAGTSDAKINEILSLVRKIAIAEGIPNVADEDTPF